MHTGFKILIGAAFIGTGGFLIYKLMGKGVSKKGIDFIKALEGFRNKAYKDSRGLLTTGVGHLIKPGEQNLISQVLTPDQVNALLKKDLAVFEKTVRDTIKVPLTNNQRDALISLAFNIGSHGFENSQLAKFINAKASKDAIIKGFSAWHNPAELIPRRAKEARLYFEGDYSPMIAQSELKNYFTA